MSRTRSTEQVPQGTLDLLILKTLSLAPMHGWGLTHRIQQLSNNALRVDQGSICPAPGCRAPGEELASRKRFVGAVALVIDATA